MDIGDGTSTECDLSAISETETALLSDKDPQKGDIIMYRTTISDGREKGVMHVPL